ATPTDSRVGTPSANYALTPHTTLFRSITPRGVTVTGTTAANKVYDRTTGATLTGGTLVGVLGGDSVSLTQSGSFASANVGSAIAVTANDSLAGTSAGNYALAQPTGLAA